MCFTPLKIATVPRQKVMKDIYFARNFHENTAIDFPSHCSSLDIFFANSLFSVNSWSASWLNLVGKDKMPVIKKTLDDVNVLQDPGTASHFHNLLLSSWFFQNFQAQFQKSTCSFVEIWCTCILVAIKEKVQTPVLHADPSLFVPTPIYTLCHCSHVTFPCITINSAINGKGGRLAQLQWWTFGGGNIKLCEAVWEWGCVI